MPSYQKNPLVATPPILLVAGHYAYLFGSLPEDVAPPIMQVTSVAITSDVATVGVVMLAGNIPNVGDLVSIQGTQTGSGEFNVTEVALTAVSISATTGIGTISFDLTESNVSTTTDSGKAYIETVETFETIANGSSIPVTVQFNDPETNIGRTLTLVVNTPGNTLQGTVVAQLEGALLNRDSDYVKIGSTISITTSAAIQTQAYTLEGYRFYRLNISGITGGAGTIAAKIM